MPAEVNPAPVSIEAALPLYLAAKAAVKEAELELLAAQKAAGEEPPESLKEELARLTTSLIGQQRALIRALNDRFRSTLSGGRVLLTRGVSEKGREFTTAAFAAVRAFTAFGPDNDPHGEHDFGSLSVAGTKLYFKIDYYDAAERFGSEDPADPSMTTRVLTILLPEEY
jgi:hypothetical protein